MAEATRRRGSGDTPLFSARGPTRRMLPIALGIALLLHVPLVPSSLFAWLQLFVMMRGSGEAEDLDGEVIIPIDLDLIGEDPSRAGGTPPPAPPDEPESIATASPTATPPKPPKPRPDELDAGADASIDAPVDAPVDAPSDAPADAPADASTDAPADAPADAAPDASGDVAARGAPDAADGVIPLFALDAGVDAEARDAGDAGDDAATDAGPDAGAVVASTDAGAPEVRDPLDRAGSPSSLAGKNPNVQILIAGDRIRSHQLGEGFGKILRSIPQWSGFFRDTNIDPIKDMDHMLLAGPQFQGDSSRVVAVMDYNRPDKDVRAAIDGIVTRSKGEWLKDAPVPAAKAKADRVERIFALVPEKNLLVILPAKEEEQLKRVKSIKSFNKSSPVAIVLSLVSPSRPFKGFVKLPESFKWLRLAVTPTDEGGAKLDLEAEDASPDEATAHAAELTKAVDLLREAYRITNPLPFGPKTIDVIDRTEFVAHGKFVRTTTRLSVRQLKGIMKFAEQFFEEQRQKAGQRTGKDPGKGP